MKTITLEEHYGSPSFMNGPGRGLAEHAKNFTGPRANLLAQLCDVGDKRVSEMDAAGIDVQVLSLNSPGVEQLEADFAIKIARESNDFIGQAIKLHPTRFAGFATLPTMTPKEAVNELERTVREYGFKGALINGHVGDRYLDNRFFWPIFEKAEALGVPIYIHPTEPLQEVRDTYYGGFKPGAPICSPTPAGVGISKRPFIFFV